MKLRNLLIVLAVTLSCFTFSSCSEDERDQIIPKPLNNDEAAATVGDDPENVGPMD